MYLASSLILTAAAGLQSPRGPRVELPSVDVYPGDSFGHQGIRAFISPDLVRGLAAFLVPIDHIHHLYFGFEPQPPPGGSQPFGTWFFFVLTSAGMQAVVIFFVLSGYLGVQENPGPLEGPGVRDEKQILFEDDNKKSKNKRNCDCSADSC